jgi:hypothetical protein
MPNSIVILANIITFLSGIYMLTELGHGLDARNLQTVATLLPDGGFDLHTPTPDAAKYVKPINQLMYAWAL